MPDASRSLTRRVRLGYALGSVATGTFGTVPGLVLLPYLTDTLGVAAGVAGLVVFAPKAWDVVLNPVAGRISDRSQDPRGPRRPFLLRAGLLLALAFALLFASPGLGSRGAETAWVLVFFVACASAYAFFQVPYVAMPAELTDSYDERTRLMTWRVAVLALAIMVSGAAAPAVRDAVGGRDGYRVMGVVVALLLVVGTLGAYLGTRDAPTGRPAAAADAGSGGLREQLRVVARHRDFRLLLTTFVVQAVAVGAMLAGVSYVARWVLGQQAAASLLFVCFVGPALLLTPVWGVVGRRVGKQRAYLLSSLVLAVAALLLLLARSAPTWWVYAATALVGAGYAGVQVFPLAMLADAAAVGTRRDGTQRAGVYTGVWTAGETLGLAIGPAAYAGVLALGGYVSTDAPADFLNQHQPDSAITAIVLGFSALPAALVLLSLLPLLRYSLDAATVTGTQPDAAPATTTDERHAP
ncbi:MAG: major facilitator superfamily 1 [Marmoricola sp.]|nr:major facilitator superfamily 1 [Marmoricola sp.]